MTANSPQHRNSKPLLLYYWGILKFPTNVPLNRRSSFSPSSFFFVHTKNGSRSLSGSNSGVLKGSYIRCQKAVAWHKRRNETDGGERRIGVLCLSAETSYC